MPFSFTLFEPKKSKPSKTSEPLVELKESGRILFNKPASALLERRPFCMLGYDNENNAVGILPLSDHQINCIPVRYTMRGAYIGATKVLRHFNILPESTLQNRPIQSGQYIAIKL